MRTITERRIGLILLLILLTNLLALVAYQLRSDDQPPSSSDVGTVSPTAVVTVLLVFHYTLYMLQVSHLMPTEVTSLCYALVAGCVRYHISVLAAGPLPRKYMHPEDGSSSQYIHPEVGSLSLSDDDAADYIDIINSNSDDAGDGSSVVKVVVATIDCSTDMPGNEQNTVEFSRENEYFNENQSESKALSSSITKEVDRFQLRNRLRSLGTSLDFTEEKHQREAVSRRQLLRYVFHEMRAPLNAISMAVELLTNHYKSGATPKSRNTDLETLQLIEEASLTMERTLKDAMTLQKIEEGVLVPQVKIFSVHDICDDITDALSQVLKSSSVSFKYEIAEEVPLQIVGDHFRIRHVVAHVLSNAIKYSKRGGIVNMQVSLRSGQADQLEQGDEQIDDEGEGGVPTTQRAPSLNTHRTSLTSIQENTTTSTLPESVVFCITDSGVGISRELQQNDIFKPFKTLKTEEIKGFRGSGLGLAICKKIMHFLHGSITYTSVPNEGTTFKVVLPLVRLDSNSMDECDSDHEDGTEHTTLATATVYSSLYKKPPSICTSTAVTPKTLLHRAKSFRGRRLLNILQTQSNVFDCPTPKSVLEVNAATSQSQDPVGSEHSEYSRGRSGTGEDGSGDLYPEHTCASLLASIDESDNHEFMTVESESMNTTSSIAAGDIDSLPTKPKGRSIPTAPPRCVAHTSSPDKIHFMRSLSVDTTSVMSGIEISSSLCTSEDFQHAIQQPEGETSTATHPFSVTPPVPCSLPTGVANIHARVGRSSSRDYGLGESPLRHNREYVALTEKNVNLHILRTASSDVTRALQFPRVNSSPAPKDHIPCFIGACKVLVVDGKQNIIVVVNV